MENKTAKYLVWHWDKGDFNDPSNKMIQTTEYCEIPADKTKVDEMKSIFSDFLNKKYGKGLLSDKIISEPKATETFSKYELMKMGMVGVYKKSNQ